MSGRLSAWDAPRRPADTPAVDGWVAAVDAMIQSRRLTGATAQSVHDMLVGGRFGAWRQAHDRHRLTDVSGDDLASFLAAVARGPDNPEGPWAPATVRKMRQHIGWLRAWAVETTGADPFNARALRTFRAPIQTRDLNELPPLTREEVSRLLAAARSGRDRVILHILSTTGMRPSELVALDVDDVRLDRRPPRIDIRRGTRDGLTKTPAGVRSVPVEIGGRSIVRELRRYLDHERARDGTTSALLLSSRRTPLGDRARYSQVALGSMLERLGLATKIPCNAYRFRHSVCSWMADAGLPEHALMTLMGWADRSMIDRYYRRRPERALEMAARIRF